MNESSRRLFKASLQARRAGIGIMEGFVVACPVAMGDPGTFCLIHGIMHDATVKVAETLGMPHPTLTAPLMDFGADTVATLAYDKSTAVAEMAEDVDTLCGFLLDVDPEYAAVRHTLTLAALLE